MNDNLVAPAQSQGGFAGAIVNAHMPGIDCPLQRGPAECRQPLGKKHVQPLSRLLGRDGEALRPG
jgi:hypothetical protein